MALQVDTMRMERLRMALHKALDTAISTSLHIDIHSIVKKDFGEMESELLHILFPTRDQDNTLSGPSCTYFDSSEETYLHSLHQLRKKIEQDFEELCTKHHVKHELNRVESILNRAKQRNMHRAAILELSQGEDIPISSCDDLSDDRLGQDPYESIQEERQKALQCEKNRLLELKNSLQEEIMQDEEVLQKVKQDAVAQMEKIELETEALPFKAGEVERRNLVAFWSLGFLNNIGYVIMLAGAQDIVSSGVGLVYFFDIFPAVLVKISGPYWFHLISYRERTFLGAGCMLASFLLLALGSSFWVHLLGIAFSGLQSGMMEPTYLAMASYYHSRKCLTCWASGTGLAGVGGYLWIAFFRIGLGWSFTTTLLLACVFPFLYAMIFLVVLDTSRLSIQPSYCRPAGHKYKSVGKENGRAAETPTLQAKLFMTVSLWPYILPLLLVYFAEYTMQSGVWSSIGFPMTNPNARAKFYSTAGLMYQLGVFLARSSGGFWQASGSILFILASLQVLLLAFFISVAIWHIWYNWSLLCFTFMAGILGGSVYVNAYTLLATQIRPDWVEFALSATSIGDTLGIMLADIVSVMNDSELKHLL
uniref:Cln3like protein putative n=1 Tax=Albugo laibachii Nc14 TaxID=890382 RepID=F0W456_9STRA|nr:cln3like protein putative [Albugo laibachii Nc14]|eukprot:CCA15854.1 cln3like protein putative [Albugo laibachii Nc14]